MRLKFIASAFLCLAACGGQKAGDANHGQANMQNGAAPRQALPPSMSAVRGDTAKRIMHERHEGMESIGKANKAIWDQLQKGSPDLSVVRSSAAKIASLSQAASNWFHAGTGPEAGNTGAKPQIWQNPWDFSAKLGTFQTAASSFDLAARGNDLGQIKARFGSLGGACKACHDKYRSKMHH